MRNWFKNVWEAVSESLWFAPAVMTLLAAVLAVAVMAAERQGLIWGSDVPWWLYQGDPQGARNVLSTITSSLITVTGVVFSVTIVAVQLASSQFTPRVLRDFSSDRGNQLVLGIFISTFTFALLVLRTVRESKSGEEIVPRLAVTVAVAMLLVCVGALIYFINHLAREIHITALVDRVARETMDNVHKLFPEHLGRAVRDPAPDPREPEHDSVTVSAAQAGYLQSVDEDDLFKLGERGRIVIRMHPKIGDYVLQGRPLASVHTAGRVNEELDEAIRKAFVLGPERTPKQNVEYGIIQISDIAIKGLSPSINDPTTAIRCIDRLAELLAEFGTREPPEPRRTRDGRVCFIASHTTFEEAVKLAYDDIRHFGAPIPLITLHMLHVLGELHVLLPESRGEPIVDQARAVVYSAREEVTNPRDLAAIEEAVRDFSKKTGATLDQEPEGK